MVFSLKNHHLKKSIPPEGTFAPITRNSVIVMENKRPHKRVELDPANQYLLNKQVRLYYITKEKQGRINPPKNTREKQIAFETDALYFPGANFSSRVE